MFPDVEGTEPIISDDPHHPSRVPWRSHLLWLNSGSQTVPLYLVLLHRRKGDNSQMPFKALSVYSWLKVTRTSLVVAVSDKAENFLLE